MVLTQQPQADLIHKPRVTFNKDDFHDAIDQKGYIVYLENAIECPCRSVNDAGGYSPFSNCKNCGGLGYFYVNKRETKMILSAMNMETKYKEWSEEKIGTVKITAKDEDDISFMDRITLKNSRAIHKEVLEPLYDYENNRPFYRTTYDIKNIKQLFRFRGPDLDLVYYGDGTGSSSMYGYIRNEIEFSPLEATQIKNDNEPYPFKIAVYYEHLPQFHVIDMSRDIMTTRVFDEDNEGKITPKNLPVHAIGRRSHFVFDDVNGGLFDNSWLTDLDYNGANC